MSGAHLLHVTFIRTSCVLLEWGQTAILTDPWFSRWMRFLPARVKPGLPLGLVPVPDIILCSHLHADHFDRLAITRVASSRTVLVGPEGLGRHVPRGFHGPVEEMLPGTRRQIGGAALQAVAVNHTFPPPDEIGIRIELGPFRLFFGGDAAYGSGFSTAAQLGPSDIALLPVGGTRIWGRRTVMDATEAAQAAVELGVSHVVPLHPGGEWASLPPMSRHPGRLDDLRREARGRFVPVVLGYGERGTFAATKDGVIWQDGSGRS